MRRYYGNKEKNYLMMPTNASAIRKYNLEIYCIQDLYID